MPIESAGEINEIKLNDVEKTKKTWLELIINHLSYCWRLNIVKESVMELRNGRCSQNFSIIYSA